VGQLEKDSWGSKVGLDNRCRTAGDVGRDSTVRTKQRGQEAGTCQGQDGADRTTGMGQPWQIGTGKSGRSVWTDRPGQDKEDRTTWTEQPR
jgi:hypothetical protein